MRALLATLLVVATLLTYNQPLDQFGPTRPKHRPYAITMDEFRTAGHQDGETERQLKWLALNVYYEARGESIDGQRAVAWVTLNRVRSDHWPSTIKRVVTQRSQFSWYQPGATYRPKERPAWRKAQAVARMVYVRWLRGAPDITGGADHYHNKSVNPVWAKSSKQVSEIGYHKFYDLY